MNISKVIRRKQKMLPVFLIIISLSFTSLSSSVSVQQAEILDGCHKQTLLGQDISSTQKNTISSFQHYPKEFKEQVLFEPDTILIKIKPDVFTGDSSKVATKVSAYLDDAGLDIFSVSPVFVSVSSDKTKFQSFGLDRWFKLTLDESQGLHQIENMSCIQTVQRDEQLSLYLEPDDPYYSSSGSWGQDYQDLYGMHLINAAGAWDISTGSRDIVVAVVDTGIDHTHPDLAGNMWINEDEIPGNGLDDDSDGFVDNIYGADFSDNDGDSSDYYGHGTHCAGTIAALGNNNLGVVGVNWQTRIMSVKAFPNATDSTFASALQWAADNGADVISNSWGKTVRGPSDPILEDAVRYATEKGCIVVFAAGNKDDDVQYYSPQNMEETVTVAATDWNDKKANFSNWGELVDVCAPGVNILSLRAEGTDMYDDGQHTVDEHYCYANGTSMACPHVAGLVALMLAKNGNLTLDMIKTLLHEAVDPVTSDVPIGPGRIDASDSLSREPALALLDIPDWDDVRGMACVNGTAWGKLFDYYVVEYGPGRDPSSWVGLCNASTPVQDDILVSFDTTLLEDGTYTIRLWVVCTDGVYSDCEMIVVNNECTSFVVGPKGDDSADFFSIQDAVNVSGAGDEVFVRAGSYYENVLVDRSLSLFGENVYSTWIIGDEGPVLKITGDQVLVHDFTIKEGTFEKYLDACVYVSGDQVELTDVVLYPTGNSDDFTGLLLYRCFNTYISDVTVRCSNIKSGLRIIGGESNSITTCCFTGAEYGVVLEGTCSNHLMNNSVFSNDRGVFVVTASSENHFKGNVVGDNSFNGIVLSQYSTGNIIEDNIIFNNGQYGLWVVWGSNENIVTGNLISGHTYGIQIVDLDGQLSSYDNVIYRNDFVNNSEDHAQDMCENVWYHPMFHVGNYWEDYMSCYPDAEDADGDGIWDDWYSIPGGANTDRYPLVSCVWGFYAILCGSYEGIVDSPITFQGMVFSGLSPYNWSWDFGDNTTSTQKNPTYSYASTGTYPVMLTVTDAEGKTATSVTTAVIMSPPVYNSNQGRYYWSTQAAVQEAHNLDTIYVKKGTYYEHVTITREISLIGADPQTTIIDGNNTGDVLYIDADRVYVSGFTIQHAGSTAGDSGVHILGNSVTISGTIITNNSWTGAYCSELTRFNKFYDNLITNSVYGIRLSGRGVVMNNTIDLGSMGSVGIYGSFDNDGNRITENTVTMQKGYHVLFTKGSENNRVYKNNFIMTDQTKAYSDGSNTWDDGYVNGGNYWSLHSLFIDEFHGSNQDLPGSDGLVDTRFSILGGTNKDRYPLMMPFNGLLQAYTQGSYEGIATVPVEFHGLARGGTLSYNYHWDFGDGTTSSELSPTHNYTHKGNYTVLFSVTDSQGNTAAMQTYALIDVPPVHNLDTGVYYVEIQDAVEDSNAGDTITVRNGTYSLSSSLCLSRPITILGENRETTILTFPGMWAISISDTQGVNIQAVTLIGDRGVNIARSSHVNISDTAIMMQREAFLISTSQKIQVTKNSITGSAGVYLLNVQNSTLFHNSIADTSLGVYLDGSTKNNVLVENTIKNTAAVGIKIGETPSVCNNTFYHNNFCNNTVDVSDPLGSTTVNNQWYHQILQQGNYWDAFDENVEAAYDNNTDGIIDTSYAITQGITKDCYPLRYPYTPGDMDHDGVADVYDIDAFVLALIHPDDYRHQYKMLSTLHGDINQDVACDVFDIDGFVALITS